MSAAKRVGRRNFTAEEDDAIWQYVNVENTRDAVAGIQMWRLLQQRLPGRSADTLRQRYLKTLQPNMARQLQGREPPVAWEGLRVVGLALEPSPKRQRQAVKGEGEGDREQEEAAEDAAALAAMAEDGAEEDEDGLTRGTVRRWLRNLPVLSEPLVACLGAEGSAATVWDGAESAAVELGPEAAMERGKVYRVARSWSMRRAGELVVRLLEAAPVEGRAVDADKILATQQRKGGEKKSATPAKKTPQKLPAVGSRADKGKEELEDDEEAEEKSPSPARAVAAELAESAGCSRALALHALYVCCGLPADAFDYLSGGRALEQQRFRPWALAEDAALCDPTASPLRLKLDPRLAARSAAEVLQRKRFLGLAP